MNYIPVIFFGLIVMAVAATYILHKLSNWMSRFSLIAHDAIRPTVYCANCPDPVHGCTHFKGVPSTWEHQDGHSKCKRPYSGAPPNATAFHS